MRHASPIISPPLFFIKKKIKNYWHLHHPPTTHQQIYITNRLLVLYSLLLVPAHPPSCVPGLLLFSFPGSLHTFPIISINDLQYPQYGTPHQYCNTVTTFFFSKTSLLAFTSDTHHSPTNLYIYDNIAIITVTIVFCFPLSFGE